MSGFNETLAWRFGLIAADGKYLTAEKFGFKINASAAAMKPAQIWDMEGPVAGPPGHEAEDDWIYLRSYLNRYLGVDDGGNVSGDAEEKGEKNKFKFMPQDDGRLALMAHNGFFFGGTGEQLSAKSHGPGATALAPTDLWTIHLAMHPQVNLRNVRRSTYLHLTAGQDGANVKEAIPWGQDSMITLEFDYSSGKYALRMSNSKYLNENGKLSESRGPTALYTVVFLGTAVAFRGQGGKYLAGVADGRAECRQNKITKDELWKLEDSHPQATFVAVSKPDRAVVSIRSTLEVTANQDRDDITDKEIFQLEINKSTNRWAIRGANGKYFTSSKGSVIHADSEAKGDTEFFDIEWYGPQVALKANNGKYLTVKRNGALVAAGEDGSAPEARFIFDLINRPILVLRGPYGFIGVKGESLRLECNRSSYDVFKVTHKDGVYHLQGANGKWWKQDSDGFFTTNGDAALDFHFKLLRHTHVSICAPNGKLLKGEKNGSLTSSGTEVNQDTLWEY
ncbi:fascin-like isoform X2 [Corticium candelabrum]|uniref:fascin-like isoform X2 n=1 Tax=Corticium candelabrum TaxID=121492 RepID=UPI002E32AAC5|nr:fascin-like isoform X2 [Corticium candelabrum]